MLFGTSEINDTLSAQGFDVYPGYIQSLIRERVLPAPEKGPGGAFFWHDADVDRLKSILRRRGRGPADSGTQRQASQGGHLSQQRGGMR